jgi:hypothetical protein
VLMRQTVAVAETVQEPFRTLGFDVPRPEVLSRAALQGPFCSAGDGGKEWVRRGQVQQTRGSVVVMGDREGRR